MGLNAYLSLRALAQNLSQTAYHLLVTPLNERTLSTNACSIAASAHKVVPFDLAANPAASSDLGVNDVSVYDAPRSCP